MRPEQIYVEVDSADWARLALTPADLRDIFAARNIVDPGGELDTERARYAINTCDDPTTVGVETAETGCAVYCRGNPDQGTEVCEPDYPYDDDYYVTDIWGVRGHQGSVDYDEVDDVAVVVDDVDRSA